MEKSKFTYRDLDLLGKFSPDSPLRVVALIDFDAFYAQCETVRLGLSPTTPLAVQQWNAIIAINYPAREYGLKRGISVDDAKRLCPIIVLQHVATWREGETTWAYRPDFAKHMSTEKSALDPYRLRSLRCFELIRSLLPPEPTQRVEKASIDEVFLDLSMQVYSSLLEQFPELTDEPSNPLDHLPLPRFRGPLNWEDDNVLEGGDAEPTLDWDVITLNIGASIVRQIRAEILMKFKYTCSAGLARNKMLAKLGASFKKPNRQTVIPNQAVEKFLVTQKFTQLRGLGGKVGLQLIEKYESDKVADIIHVSLDEMKTVLGHQSGAWVYDAIRGRETSIVNPRIVVQSMLSAKTFVPNLAGFDQAMKWLRIFAADLVGRMNELQVDYPRRPTVISVRHHIHGRFGPTRSKQRTIPPGCVIDENVLFSWSRDLLYQLCEEGTAWPCASLSVCIYGFRELVTQNHRITSFFSKSSSKRKPLTCPSPEPPGSAQPPMKRKKILDSSDRREYIGGSYNCPLCSMMIGAAKVLEHLDWHTALELKDSNQ